jgi:lysophospholipase L1-like esterase
MTALVKGMIQMPESQFNPNIPAQPVRFTHGAPHFAKALAGGRPVKIVAIGSSSTAGEGQIAPYPYRLKMALRAAYTDRAIHVVNKGAGGDEAPGERNRLHQDVIVERPSLVIWQIGTNAVWKGEDLGEVAAAIDDGLAMLARATPAMDVVLMDLQYAPAILTDDKIVAAERMVSLISDAAARAKVNVFRRFDLMRRWHVFERISFDRMIDPTDSDRLHQSDWSARRIGQALCDVIVDAVRSTQV